MSLKEIVVWRKDIGMESDDLVLILVVPLTGGVALDAALHSSLSVFSSAK